MTPTITDSIQRETFLQTEVQYSTALDIRSTLLSLNDQETFTFTATTSRRNTTNSTNSAATTIACPSPGYTGPTLIAVYWDKLFSSFMFAPSPESERLIQGGIVTDTSGTPMINEEVTISSGGNVYYTLTDQAGRIRLPVEPASPSNRDAPVEIVVSGVKQPVTLSRSANTRIQIDKPN